MRRVFHNALYRRDSGAMSCNSGQVAARRPASVAVHDDGHMQPRRLLTLHCKAMGYRTRTLHCKVTSQKKVQARVGASPLIKLDAGSSLVTLAASRTTCSRVERYSR